MKKTLQDQYLLIKEGKGHKGVFLTEAKRQFPNIVRNAATFDEAVASLKTKNIISENVISVIPAIMDRPKKESYETAFEAFLAEAKKKNEDEKVKAEEKKVSKPVEEDLEKNFDYSDEKNPDNMIFDQIMMGYYAEMKDPKNADKTMQQLKDIVFKNLAKDPIYYTKDGQFGIKDLGYATEHPGLGEPKEAKGKYKSSGYGDLKESIRKYTKSEASKLFDYHERTGMLPQGMTKEEFNKIMSYYNIKKNYDDSIDPAGGSGLYSHLEETKLRKVIREMVDEELEEVRGGGNYGIPTVKLRGGGGERNPKMAYAPDTLDSMNEKRLRRSGDLIWDEDKKKLFVSERLYNSLAGLSKGDPTLQGIVRDAFGGSRNKIRNIIKDLYPSFAQISGTIPNPNPEVSNKGVYISPISFSVEKAPADSEKGYYKQGELLFFPYAKKGKKLKEDDIIESLRESVEKDLMDINKEAEHEVLQSKLDKIDALIDLRRSKLGKLDEDEDMKALTDKKKVKELEKDIKKLEVARNKVEKMMSKFKGKKSPDKKVIDEDEPIAEDLDVAAEYVEDATKRLNAGQNVGSIGDTYSNMGRNQKSNLIDYLNTIAPDDLKSDYVY